MHLDKGTLAPGDLILLHSGGLICFALTFSTLRASKASLSFVLGLPEPPFSSARKQKQKTLFKLMEKKKSPYITEL